jgi:hypothetical protein
MSFNEILHHEDYQSSTASEDSLDSSNSDSISYLKAFLFEKFSNPENEIDKYIQSATNNGFIQKYVNKIKLSVWCIFIVCFILMVAFHFSKQKSINYRFSWRFKRTVRTGSL